MVPHRFLHLRNSGFRAFSPPGMTAEERCTGMTEDTGTPGFDGACDSSRSG